MTRCRYLLIDSSTRNIIGLDLFSGKIGAIRLTVFLIYYFLIYGLLLIRRCISVYDTLFIYVWNISNVLEIPIIATLYWISCKKKIIIILSASHKIGTHIWRGCYFNSGHDNWVRIIGIWWFSRYIVKLEFFGK